MPRDLLFPVSRKLTQNLDYSLFEKTLNGMPDLQSKFKESLLNMAESKIENRYTEEVEFLLTRVNENDKFFKTLLRLKQSNPYNAIREQFARKMEAEPFTDELHSANVLRFAMFNPDLRIRSDISGVKIIIFCNPLDEKLNPIAYNAPGFYPVMTAGWLQKKRLKLLRANQVLIEPGKLFILHTEQMHGKKRDIEQAEQKTLALHDKKMRHRKGFAGVHNTQTVGMTLQG